MQNVIQACYLVETKIGRMRIVYPTIFLQKPELTKEFHTVRCVSSVFLAKHIIACHTNGAVYVERDLIAIDESYVLIRMERHELQRVG